jgi:ABC-type antimicrobial peptide transport system permease subunit
MSIRVALGARKSQVFALVVRQSAMPVLAGIAIGCAGALAAGPLAASLLFHVRPGDPLIVATVVTLVGGVGLLASASAARTGLRIDPAEALRNE